MRVITLDVTVQLDVDANAASIVFDPGARGRDLVTRPVEDAAGDVVATVTFSPDGRLVNMELLRAREQLANLVAQSEAAENDTTR